MKKRAIDILTVGFALFAMFFGAGNLILPPIIGLVSGHDWSFAALGFFITGILATFMGFLSVASTGNSFDDMGKRIHPLFATIVGSIIMLGIGPLIAIPRTGATTFEIGIAPLFPSVNPIVASVLFFGLTLILSLSSTKIIDIIGKFLTPLLLVILLILIGCGIWQPLNTDLSAASIHSLKAFSKGFKEGYQTMDVLAAFIFSGIVIASIKAKGYTDERQKKRTTMLSGGIAMICLFIIYGGLTYLGATSGFVSDGNIKRTELLLHIAEGNLGDSGAVFLSICVSLACLTTAIALVSAVSGFFNTLSKGVIGYRVLVTITCVVSCYLSIKGVDNIIEYAYPFLALIYPITLCLALCMITFGKRIQMKQPYIVALAVTFIIAAMQVLSFLNIGSSFFTPLLEAMPLNAYEIPWLIPSLLSFAFAYLIWKPKYERKTA